MYVLPNDFNIETIAFKADETDPDKIIDFIEEHIDREKLYEHELYSKLEEIYSAIKWDMPNRGSLLAKSVFNFSESW